MCVPVQKSTVIVTKLDSLRQKLKMSDYEDEMDIDGPVPKESILFGSENTVTKGKRIVADLPIEAEDNLPW